MLCIHLDSQWNGNHPQPTNKYGSCLYTQTNDFSEHKDCFRLPEIGGAYGGDKPSTYFENATLLQCSVLNTSYSADFA